jgi:hypothetical protein
MTRAFRIAVASACVVAWFAAVRAADRSPAAMASAASRFLSTLSPDHRSAASFPFEGPEREHWGFVPTEIFARNGLTLGAMSEAERAAAHDLLKAGLSQKGYLTATSIMQLDDVLKAIEEAGGGDAAAGRRMERNPLKYFVSVFGTPTAAGTWGWRVEGHHVSLNFTIVNGAVAASTPQFFGSNPAEVMSGPKKGLRVLQDEEDPARALLVSLTPAQRAKAVLAIAAPGDILTMNRNDIARLDESGVPASELQPDQRDLLMKVIDAYAGAMADDIASERLAKLRQAGIEKIAFTWAGGDSAATSSITASRGRRFSWSSTKRRTTAITSTRCGAISTAISAATFSANTSRGIIDRSGGPKGPPYVRGAKL